MKRFGPAIRGWHISLPKIRRVSIKELLTLVLPNPA